MVDVAENLAEVGRRLIGMIGLSDETDGQLAWCAGRVAEGADEIEQLREALEDLVGPHWREQWAGDNLTQREPTDGSD